MAGAIMGLIIVVISMIVFCFTQPSLSQSLNQFQIPNNDTNGGIGSLAHLLRVRENLKESRREALESQFQGEGRQALPSHTTVWANPADEPTCHYHWNIQVGAKCDDPNSPAYFTKTSRIFKKYNIDEISMVVDNDADNQEFPLAAARDLSRLNCAGSPMKTFCLREECSCLENPCEEGILPTAITLEECDRIVDATTPPPPPRTTTQQWISSTFEDLEGLGGAIGASTPSPRRQPQGQGHFLAQLSFSVTVSLLAAALFGAGAGA